jgi:branched-chain amino acid transport system permease protein
LVLGVILSIETVARYTAGEGESNIVNLLGIPFDTTTAATWVVAAVLVVGGFLVARMTWRRIAEAWDRAATVARDRGHLA